MYPETGESRPAVGSARRWRPPPAGTRRRRPGGASGARRTHPADLADPDPPAAEPARRVGCCRDGAASDGIGVDAAGDTRVPDMPNDAVACPPPKGIACSRATPHDLARRFRRLGPRTGRAAPRRGGSVRQNGGRRRARPGRAASRGPPTLAFGPVRDRPSGRIAGRSGRACDGPRFNRGRNDQPGTTEGRSGSRHPGPREARRWTGVTPTRPRPPPARDGRPPPATARFGWAPGPTSRCD